MKTKVIVLGTGSATRRFILENQDSEYIDILGIILDESVEEEYKANFLSELNEKMDGIHEYHLVQPDIIGADIIFSPEYRRIIPAELCDKHLFVNCHGGILPKWRGFSANAWAIMNGEKEIGFSIHRVRPGLDDGEVYYVKHIPITEKQTYGDVHVNMVDGIVKDVPRVLCDIVNGNLTGKKQPDTGFAYCNRFIASMGDISGFANSASYYLNLYRCMAKPLGTGVWFCYKGEKYNVGRIEHGKEYGVVDYYGINGKIVNISNGKLWVKTSDNVVVLSEIERENITIDVNCSFRIGNRLM